MKILIADNDASVISLLSKIMETEGFDIVTAANGKDALALFESAKPDFLCLDIIMPEMTGYEVCKKIREKGSNAPIILLSSKSQEIDKVLGLELGADDYITKPFGPHEVIARIRAVARRCLTQHAPQKKEDHFTMGDLAVYPAQLRAVRGGKDIEINLRDVKILELLYSRKNDVITRDDLLDHCWGKHIMAESRTIDQSISQLRKRIEKDPADPQIVRTVHGAGYRYSE